MRKGMLARSVICAALVVCSLGVTSRLGAVEGFLRGDVDLSGRLSVSDAIRILQYLFSGDIPAVPCEDSADVDDNGKLELTDAIGLLQSLFQGRVAPPAPFPRCGADPTDDALGCASPRECDPTFRYWDIELEGGCVVWVIDRSGTMQDSGEMARAKKHAVETIEAFTEDFEFAVIFSDKSVAQFPSSGIPARATDDFKATGTRWINSVAGGSGSCDQAALLRALEIANRSSASARAILYVSDGGGTCPGSDDEQAYLRQTIARVTAANTSGVRVHSVQVIPAGQIQEAFMRELAEKNGGTYHGVQ